MQALIVNVGGIGTALDTSKLASAKIIEITGLGANDSLEVEVSTDGVNFNKAKTFTQADNVQHLTYPVSAIRTDATNTATGGVTATVDAAAASTQAQAIPTPALDAAGVSIDISALGDLSTCSLNNLAPAGAQVRLEVSNDDVNFSALHTFTEDDSVVKNVTHKFIRAVSIGAVVADLSMVSEGLSASAGGSRSQLYFNPSAIAGGSLYNDFNALMDAVEAEDIGITREIFIDCRDAVTVNLPPRAAGGRYPFRDITMVITPVGKPTGGFAPDLIFDDGCLFDQLAHIRAVGETGIIQNENNTDVPIVLLNGVDGGPQLVLDRVEMQQGAANTASIVENTGWAAIWMFRGGFRNPNANAVSGAVKVLEDITKGLQLLFDGGAVQADCLEMGATSRVFYFSTPGGINTNTDLSTQALVDPAATFVVGGAVKGNWWRHALVVADGNPVSAFFDQSMQIDTTAFAQVVNLPPAGRHAGRGLKFQMLSGANPATLVPESGTIGGQATLDLRGAGAFIELESDGDFVSPNWKIASSGSSSSGRSAVTLNPSATELSKVLFNDFNALMDDIAADPLVGERTVIIDCRDAVTVTLPPRTAGGRYPFRDISMKLTPVGKPTGGNAPDVIFDDGCLFDELAHIWAVGETGVIQNENNTDEPLVLIEGLDGGPSLVLERIQIQQGAANTASAVTNTGGAAIFLSVAGFHNPNANAVSGALKPIDDVTKFLQIIGDGGFVQPDTLEMGPNSRLFRVAGPSGWTTPTDFFTQALVDPAATIGIAGHFMGHIWRHIAIVADGNPVSAFFDQSLEIDTTSFDQVVNLPPAGRNEGRGCKVKLTSNANSAILTPASGTIEGQATYVMRGTGSFVELEAGGSFASPNWKIISRGSAASTKLSNLGAPAAADATGVHAAYAGNVATPFPGAFTNPDVPRAVRVVYGVGYDGGDTTVTGTGPNGEAVVEVITAVANSTVEGTKAFATVTAADQAAVGASADTASIGFGLALSLLQNIADADEALLFANGVGEAGTFDATENTVVTTTAPNGAVNFKALANS